MNAPNPALDAQRLFESRCWFSPFLRERAERALFSIQALTAAGDCGAARVWRDALSIDLEHDIKFEQVCTQPR